MGGIVCRAKNLEKFPRLATGDDGSKHACAKAAWLPREECRMGIPKGFGPHGGKPPAGIGADGPDGRDRRSLPLGMKEAPGASAPGAARQCGY